MIKDNFKELNEDVQPAIKECGFRLVEFNYSSINHGRTFILKLVIDKIKKNGPKDGITHSDCVKVTKIVEEEINRRFKENELDYTIEVSSFGLGRAFSTIEDYEANTGVEIEVKLNKKINDFFKFSGILREIITDENGMKAINIQLTWAGDKKIEDYLKKKKKNSPDVEFPVDMIIPIEAIAKTIIKINF